jgi:hypothetical protein
LPCTRGPRCPGGWGSGWTWATRSTCSIPWRGRRHGEKTEAASRQERRGPPPQGRDAPEHPDLDPQLVWRGKESDQEFRIADTFTESLARLTGDEQKAVKTTAFDLPATLRINYRTSHQIRAQADRLLARQITDVDGNTEDRRATISVFNGPAPRVHVAGTADEEFAVVGRWLAERAAEGIAPGEMAVFVRLAAELPRARATVQAAGLSVSLLDDGSRSCATASRSAPCI